MTRIEILNSYLTTLQTEKLTAVGARLRYLDRRITVITDALYQLYNYPVTTVSATYIGNDWRIICDATRLMIQAKIGDAWESIQIFEKPSDLILEPPIVVYSPDIPAILSNSKKL